MLNDNQIIAVNHKTGPCLTLAGPGSGKTTVLVERIQTLVETGVSPENILVITFTKDAAGEMKARFQMKTMPKVYPVTFGTFHSVFYQILRSVDTYRNHSLISGYKKMRLLKESLYFCGVKNPSKEILAGIEKDLSFYANTRKPPWEDGLEYVLEEEEFYKVLKEYEKRKSHSLSLDFDDMLIKTKELLKNDPKVRRKWQERFSYFLVDELQDINQVQFDVLKLLVKNHPCGNENIFGVGDDDQSIYGFRGSSPSFMLEFPGTFENTKEILLDKNYRSGRDIVHYSKVLIENNKERFKKDYSSESKIDGKVSLLQFEDDRKQAEYILDLVLQEKKEGCIKDTAVLFRNGRFGTTLCSMLMKEGVEVFTKEELSGFKDSFLEEDICSYMRLIIKKGSRRDFINILNKPDRGLSKGAIGEGGFDFKSIMEYYPPDSFSRTKIKELADGLELMGSFSPYSAINFILKGMNYEDYFYKMARQSRMTQEDSGKMLSDFLEYIKGFPTIEEFLKDVDGKKEKKEPKKKERGTEKIGLYTFHASKGLEFERVFIIDACEGMTPSKNAITTETLEEERRMFYVAMTRAKEELYICVPKNGEAGKTFPSRFISEMGISLKNG